MFKASSNVIMYWQKQTRYVVLCLSLPKEGGNIEKIYDIKGVTTDESDFTKTIDTDDVTNSIISGIKHFKSCSSCKGLEGTNNKFVRCSKYSKIEEAVDMYSATLEVKDGIICVLWIESSCMH